MRKGPISLDDLRIDAGTQIRQEIDQKTVDRYAEAIQEGAKLPPLIVYTDEQTFWLVDGFHRYFAYKKSSRKQAQAEIHEGTLDDAIAAACAVNREHDTVGLARTNMDKRRAVQALLRLSAWQDKSTRMIGEHIGVSHRFIQKIKSELETVSNAPDGKIKTKDGRTYPVKRTPKTTPQPKQPASRQEEERKEDPEIFTLTPETSYANGHDIHAYYTIPQWEALDDAERLRLLHVESKGAFNKTNDNVEWALWTWNPVTGCLHDCPYCYARDIANRYYTGYGFTPVFHPHRLHIPAHCQPPKEAVDQLGLRNVFVCSMADLFGKWVPEQWIQAVIDSCANAPQWNFLFLTKFPTRLAQFSFPDNAWVGTSVDAQARVAAAEKAFQEVQAKVKWMSCEPLLEPLQFTSLEMFDWVVLGGASRSEQTPEYRPPRRWVVELESQALQADCQVYEKTNLHGPDRIREYPGQEASLGIPKELADFDYPILKKDAYRTP